MELFKDARDVAKYIADKGNDEDIFFTIRNLMRRLELPRGISPTATSTLRVYQFRHSRKITWSCRSYPMNFFTPDKT